MLFILSLPSNLCDLPVYGPLKRRTVIIIQFLCCNRKTSQRNAALPHPSGFLPDTAAFHSSAVLGIDGIMYAGPAADAIAFLTSVFLISHEMKKMKLAEIAK